MTLRESSHKFESNHKDSSKCKKVLHLIDCFETSLPIQRVPVKVLNTKAKLKFHVNFRLCTRFFIY